MGNLLGKCFSNLPSLKMNISCCYSSIVDEVDNDERNDDINNELDIGSEVDFNDDYNDDFNDDFNDGNINNDSIYEEIT